MVESISRRSFVASTIATGLAVSGSSLAQAEQAGQFIDAHVHVWSPDTKAYPLAAGFSPKDMKPASFTPEELFKHCKPAGVGRIALIQMSFYGFDNSYVTDSVKAHPERFTGVFSVDVLVPDAPQWRYQHKMGEGLAWYPEHSLDLVHWMMGVRAPNGCKPYSSLVRSSSQTRKIPSRSVSGSIGPEKRTRRRGSMLNPSNMFTAAISSPCEPYCRLTQRTPGRVSIGANAASSTPLGGRLAQAMPITGMSILGKMSAGVREITTGLRMSINRARTTKV